MNSSESREDFFRSLADCYQLPVADVAAKLGVQIDVGLSSEEVARRQQIYGRNEFPPEKGTPLWLLILKQFTDLLVIILILAALVSFILAFFEEEDVTTAFIEPLVIVLILVVNATVGVLQESSAEAAVEALKKFDPERATVLRDGKISEIKAAELVPGDVVEVSVGDQVPADMRVVSLYSIAVDVDQSLLTGESQQVEKIVEPIDIPDAQIQDKKNMVFSGTTIARGKLRGIVVGTGLFTEKGKIRDRLSQKKEEKFPLRERLDKFGQNLSISIGVICAIVWIINIPHFSDPSMGGWLRGAIFYFKVAVSLAVAAIPEGLPAVITTCLALGTSRMAKKNAIVTSLPAVETLGCTNVICSDKTGTLTTNQMSVLKFFVLGNAKGVEEIVEFDVEGVSYAPVKEGNINFAVTSVDDYPSFNLKKGDVLDVPAAFPSIAKLARVCSLNNDASISVNKGQFEKVGQSTEAALKVLVEKLLVPSPKDNTQIKNTNRLQNPMLCNKWWEKKHEKLVSFEFDRQRKSMSVLIREKDTGKQLLLVKGAWDAVLNRCTNVFLNGSVVPLKSSLRDKLTKKTLEYCEGENNFRCLTIAELETNSTLEEIKNIPSNEWYKLESNLTFIGVVGILDPPRQEVHQSIRACKEAGIRVIVVTGDNKNTAVSICKKIGIFEKDEDPAGKAFTGQEFKKMSERQQLEAVKTAKLFARVEPVDKQNLVKLLHKDRMVVAMTGDGVNDAPALAEADIGIAMGSGTAVAKGAAKMVLADDNFATIVAAIEEGRNIYNNTKHFIRYLICSNIGEVVAIFAAAVLGLPEVLLPVQLLWVNLVTDGLPAVALSFNKPEEDIMRQPPRPRDEPIVTNWTLFRFLLIGTYIGFATVAGFVWWFLYYGNGPHLQWNQLFVWSKCNAASFGGRKDINCDVFLSQHPNTIALSILVTIEMFQALNSLSESGSLFSRYSHPLSNMELIKAIALSFGLHFGILYIPFFQRLFSVSPLTFEEWVLVVFLSFPVIFLEEVVKFFYRKFVLEPRRVKID